jgi:hypothetical protein
LYPPHSFRKLRIEVSGGFVLKVVISTKSDGFDVDVMSDDYRQTLSVSDTIFSTAVSCAKGTFQGPYFHVNEEKNLIIARSSCNVREAAVDEVIFLISDTLDSMGYKIEIIPL